MKSLIKQILNEYVNEGLHNTSWTNDKGTVTLNDILLATKNIPVKNISVEKLRDKVLDWNGNPDEIEKISASELEYPILIILNNDNSIKYILDGHHRTQKAIRGGLKMIKAKLIKPGDIPEWMFDVVG